MLTLVLFNLGLLAVMALALVLSKKFIKTEKGKNTILIIASILTILCHYSSLAYHWLTDNSAMAFLRSNPNLLLPIYPCNVVMWCCLIFACLKNKNGKFGKFLVDFIFWFGIISCLVGMFVNVDFMNNPSLANYDVTKGIVAHGFMFFNVLLLGVLGYVKIDLPKNIINIIISIAMMFVIGLYCNLVFEVLQSSANSVNSMFILHSPIESVAFLTFPFISIFAVVAYFAVFNICELFAYKKGERWVSRLKQKKAQKTK